MIVVIANDDLKQEFLSSGTKEGADIVWVNDITTIPVDSDIYIDLSFAEDRIKRKQILATTKAGVIIVNDVTGTTKDLPVNYVRINGWPTFLKRTIIEASCDNETIKAKAEEALKFFNKKTEWIPDTPGFITAKVVSTIINEAYFSIEDNVSSREEIDIAMKLGTNYPYGPFEWSKLIGVKRIYSLLDILSKENLRYIPSDLLKKEATS
jgi:3-hydroxybutyryl-CoA dehydrogenase